MANMSVLSAGKKLWVSPRFIFNAKYKIGDAHEDKKDDHKNR